MAPQAVVLCLLLASISLCQNLIPNPEFRTHAGGRLEGWKTWAPRPALAPESGVQPVDGNVNAVSLKARDFASYGKWITVVGKIRAGAVYAFDAFYQTAGISHPAVSVDVILTWCSDAEAVHAIQRDYARHEASNRSWRRIHRELRAPQEAHSLRVEFVLRWTDSGSVLWKNPRLVEVAPRKPRRARIVTTHIVPPANATVDGNLQRMEEMLDRVAFLKPDLVLFSENLAQEGVRLPIAEKADSIPGSITNRLSARAKRHRVYVATTLFEREGERLYNTAVLIDRAGGIAGRYRKTHIPMAEGEAGITPGRDYPVFDTDFGAVGMMICWDNWFPETARILRLKGAELLLFPVQADVDFRHWDVISRARAIDNAVTLITANILGHSASRIINPDGEVAAEARGGFDYAFHEVDLDASPRFRGLSVGRALGEAGSLFLEERRPDAYGPLAAPESGHQPH